MNKITILLFGLLLVACSKEVKNGKTIFLDSEETKQLRLSNILHNERYIPLETNDNCIIGYINKIQIYDNVIYILDSFFSKKLFAFDLKGKYIHTISQKGHGPGEYIDITDFVISDNKIYILNGRTSIIEFDINGKFLKEEKLHFQVDFIFKNAFDSWVLVTNSDKSPDHKYNVYVTDKNYEIKKGLIESVYSEFNIQPFQQLCTYKDTNYFYLPLENIVYSVNNNVLKKKYELKYPRNCILSANEFSTYKKMELQERIKILDATILLTNIIITKPMTFFFYRKKKETYIYTIDNENQQIFLVAEKNIINDIDGTEKIPKLYYSISEKNIVGCLFPNDLVKDSTAIRKINPKLNSLIKNFSNEKNPIISIYSVNERK